MRETCLAHICKNKSSVGVSIIRLSNVIPIFQIIHTSFFPNRVRQDDSRISFLAPFHFRKSFLRSDAFQTALQSLAEVESYKKAYAGFASAADDANKKAGQLDWKVKRWQDVPEEVLSLVDGLKKETAAYHSCAGAFRLSGKKGLSSDKMSSSMTLLRGVNVEAKKVTVSTKRIFSHKDIDIVIVLVQLDLALKSKKTMTYPPKHEVFKKEIKVTEF